MDQASILEKTVPGQKDQLIESGYFIEFTRIRTKFCLPTEKLNSLIKVEMHFLGTDLGAFSIKISSVNTANLQTIATTKYPETEIEIIRPQPRGLGLQSTDMWWKSSSQFQIERSR